MPNEKFQSTDQESTDYSQAPELATAEVQSPYPRNNADQDPKPAPVVQRIGSDLGLVVYAVLATGFLCQYPLNQTPFAINHIGIYALVGLIAVLFLQYKQQIKSWQAFPVLFVGATIGSSVFSRNDFAQLFGEPETGRSVFLTAFFLCGVGMFLLGPISRLSGVRPAKVVDPYEAFRKSWSDSCGYALLLMLVTPFSGLTTSTEEVFNFVFSLTLLALWFTRSRSCRTTAQHLTYLWSPILFTGGLLWLLRGIYPDQIAQLWNSYLLIGPSFAGVQSVLLFFMRDRKKT